ncbi:60S ribosomal protein L15, partial [Galemys pyrenaicus]
MGYKAKYDCVIYEVHIHHYVCKHLVLKDAGHSVNQLKFALRLKSVAEEQAEYHFSMYKFFEIILIDPFHKAIGRNPNTQYK